MEAQYALVAAKEVFVVVICLFVEWEDEANSVVVVEARSVFVGMECSLADVEKDLVPVEEKE